MRYATHFGIQHRQVMQSQTTSTSAFRRLTGCIIIADLRWVTPAFCCHFLGSGILPFKHPSALLYHFAYHLLRVNGIRTRNCLLLYRWAITLPWRGVEPLTHRVIGGNSEMRQQHTADDHRCTARLYWNRCLVCFQNAYTLLAVKQAFVLIC